MKTAVPLCRSRIAPLFESAETFAVIEPGTRELQPLPGLPAGASIEARCAGLQAAGTEALLCGAISCFWQAYLERIGIRVFPFLAGDALEVATAFGQRGPEALPPYAMPGRGNGGKRRKMRRRGRCDHYPNISEENEHATLQQWKFLW